MNNTRLPAIEISNYNMNEGDHAQTQSAQQAANEHDNAKVHDVRDKEKVEITVKVAQKKTTTSRYEGDNGMNDRCVMRHVCFDFATSLII